MRERELTRSMVIVDWALTILLLIMILSNIIDIPFRKAIQPLFFIALALHLIQHHEFFSATAKKAFGKPLKNKRR